MRRRILILIHSKYLFVVTSLGWWVVFYPGFYSGDSFGALSQAKTGDISNIYTAAWPLTLRIVTLGGKVPGMATLACVLILSYAVTYFCVSALPKSISRLTGALLLLTPLVGAMGITLWHDIPMTAGLLFIVSVTIKSSMFKAQLTRSDLLHLFFGSILASYRPNGMATLFLYFVILWMFIRSSRMMRFAALSVLVALIFSVATTLMVGERSLVNNIYAQEWMRSDIACTWATHPDAISQATRTKMEVIAPLTQWDNASGCTFLNGLGFSAVQVEQSTHYIPSIWLSVFKSDPFGTIRIHGQRNAYLLPIPTSIAMRPPFINSIIEFPDQGISYAYPKIVQIFRPYVRAWNALRPLTGYPGLWLSVILIMVISLRHRRNALFPALALSLALEGILFVFAPIPDGRYALPVLIMGQAFALGYILDFFLRKRGLAKK